MVHSVEDKMSPQWNGVMTEFLTVQRYVVKTCQLVNPLHYLVILMQEPKPPLLKLVMNPRGHVQDWTHLKQTGMYSEPSALSPEICHDIVKDLHSPSGRGRQPAFCFISYMIRTNY